MDTEYKEPTNEDRVKRARASVVAYKKAMDEHSDGPISDAQDLITDLLHLVHSEMKEWKEPQISRKMEACLRMAIDNFNAEEDGVEALEDCEGPLAEAYLALSNLPEPA